MLEATSMSPEFEQAFRDTGLRAFARLAQYLAGQMTAGRLRRIRRRAPILIIPVSSFQPDAAWPGRWGRCDPRPS